MSINVVELVTISEIEKVLTYFLPSFNQETTRLNVKYLAEKFYKHGRVLKAFNSSYLLGFVAFYANNHNEKSMYISLIATDFKHRNAGIGQRLLSEVIELGRIEGFEKIQLEVYKENESAINFYLKNDFVRVHNFKSNDKIVLERMIDHATEN